MSSHLLVSSVLIFRPKDAVVADFGCGEGRLALSVPQKVHSFDLVSRADHVVACDVKRTPLPDKSVDVVVFCLSLMGTNLGDFVLEANRVLKKKYAPLCLVSRAFFR